MCYIGIEGKRHSGRPTAAWLIAIAIESNIRKDTPEQFDKIFRTAVQDVINNPNEIGSTVHVTLDKFGDYILSVVKVFCPRLYDYDLEDKKVINGTYINPVTFEITTEPGGRIYHAREYEERPFKHEGYMSLEQFIIYFADVVIKNAFGRDIWTRVAEASSEVIDDNNYKIFYDVKTSAERKFIKRNGLIIKLVNEQRQDGQGYRDFTDEKDQGGTEIILNTTGDLMEMSDKFWSIGNLIINKLYK